MEKECSFDCHNSKTVKALRLLLNPNKDIFRFIIQPFVSFMTERKTLSDILKLFVPLGFLGPVIVTSLSYQFNFKNVNLVLKLYRKYKKQNVYSAFKKCRWESIFFTSKSREVRDLRKRICK